MDFKINKRFQEVLPDLRDEEYNQLEKSVLTNGVLEPLIVWNGYIVDGHKRYEICKKYNISFEYKELDSVTFEEIDVVKFIIEHHLGRRNLTSAQRIAIVCKYKEEIAKKNRKMMSSSIREKLPSSYLRDRSTNTREQIAKMAGVAAGTVARYDAVIKSGNDILIKKMMRGEDSIYGAYKKVTARKNVPQKIKKIKLLNNNNSCEICGCDISPILEFHHIKTVSDGGSNDYDNLKLICPNCHRLLHVFAGINDKSARLSFENSLVGTPYEDIKKYVS